MMVQMDSQVLQDRKERWGRLELTDQKDPRGLPDHGDLTVKVDHRDLRAQLEKQESVGQSDSLGQGENQDIPDSEETRAIADPKE